ncbi:MAG TPA: cation:proton antiporter [Roseiarcus sp.]|nr:cation:proton antiporter [Roseiarcus sp.]
MEEAADLSVYKEALLFLATAGVIAPLFFRLRVSPVLGYLLAGVALGPYGLGAVAQKAPFLKWLAISNVETIDKIAGFGVVVLLFTMGLELSFERLRRMRRLVFGLGAAQVVLTTLALMAIAWALGLKPAAAFIVGAALAMSSTAIVIPSLIESHRLAAPAGRAIFSVLLFQDVAVAPFLVLTGALAGGGEHGLAWALISRLAPAALALAALIVFGRLALRPFFHFVAETKSPEFFMAACLLVVLGDALSAAATNLSMALGAFVAGLLLAETEYRREIEVTIEPFRGLLLGLYFVSVGAQINPALISQNPGLIFGLAALLVAVKGAILFVLARGFRFPPRVGAEMGLVLGPGGEFGFVMIGAALLGGLIGRDVATTLVSAIAISMLAIPPLAKLSARIGSAPRAEVGAPPEETPPGSEDRRVIIVGYGRVGALIGDMLDVHKLPFIAVDADPRLVAKAREAGKPVYYGDATRPDYLRRCGIETTRAVVVTMDSPRANEAVVETARRLRQDVTLVARARDANHARALYGLGVTDAVPETIEASLQLSEAVLVDVGVPMGLVIASIHEKRDEYRKVLLAAGATERPRPSARSKGA